MLDDALGVRETWIGGKRVFAAQVGRPTPAFFLEGERAGGPWPTLRAEQRAHAVFEILDRVDAAGERPGAQAARRDTVLERSQLSSERFESVRAASALASQTCEPAR